MTRAKDLLNIEIEKYKSNTPLSFQNNLVSGKYMPGGNTRVTQWIDPHPFFVEKGNGDLSPVIITEQVKKGVSFSAPTESQGRLSKLLVERIPSIEKVRFTNSGTEATMLSIMAARAFTNRSKIAKFEGGYHGSQDHVSISVNTSRENLREETNPGVLEHNGISNSLLDEVLVMPVNNIEKCKELIYANKSSLAGIIMEPIISNLGYMP